MNLLDTYLKQNNTTRYQLSKVSGIPESTWQKVNERDVDGFTVKQIKAIAMVIHKKPTSVLNDLIELDNLEYKEDLNGLRKFLNQHDYSNPSKEKIIKNLIQELAENGVNVQPFSFNRIENEDLVDMEIVLNNVIDSLTTALNNIKANKPPIPDTIR
ncbi:hypothetical protein [Aerococcus urinaeequi]|uniref:hypothetical protein n=1 Tax=Aerococcus urinaeequi TaxID=51665 RepID=UPI003D6AF8E0